MSAQNQRPLSPHVGIYRWQISNTLSILHRVTGFGLSFGLVPLVLWLWGTAYDAALFNQMQHFFGLWAGKLLLLGWLAAFYYHLGNGIRHLYWDTGRGFALDDMKATGMLVVVFALSMTVFTLALLFSKGVLA